LTRELFAKRDRSVRTYHDAKVVRGVARAGLRLAVAWDELLDASWSDGDRVTLEDAVLALPRAFDLGDVAELAGIMREVGLLDDEDRVPLEAWERWYEPAARRKLAASEAAAKANAARWAARSGETPGRSPTRAPAGVRSESVTQSPPTYRPSTDSDESVGRSRARPEPASPPVGPASPPALEDDDPLGPLPPSTTAEERRNGSEGPRIPPGPAPAVTGRSGPPCRLSRELFRAHSSSHVIRGGELVGCTACDRDAADTRSFRERVAAASATAGSP
jgi:hypothetical protein